MSFYVSTATFFLLHCDEWDRVVALPKHKFVTGATLLQLVAHVYYQLFDSMMHRSRKFYSCPAIFEVPLYFIIDRTSDSCAWWRTAISCGQCQRSDMIYYAEIHLQTVEKLTWLKGTYYTERISCTWRSQYWYTSIVHNTGIKICSSIDFFFQNCVQYWYTSNVIKHSDCLSKGH